MRTVLTAPAKNCRGVKFKPHFSGGHLSIILSNQHHSLLLWVYWVKLVKKTYIYIYIGRKLVILDKIT